MPPNDMNKKWGVPNGFVPYIGKLDAPTEDPYSSGTELAVGIANTTAFLAERDLTTKGSAQNGFQVGLGLSYVAARFYTWILSKVLVVWLPEGPDDGG
jgi:hypothetical protein